MMRSKFAILLISLSIPLAATAAESVAPADALGRSTPTLTTNPAASSAASTASSPALTAAQQQAAHAKAAQRAEATRAYGEGHYEFAITILTKLAYADPKDAEVRYQLANSYLAAGMLDLAKQQYSACIGLKPPQTLLDYCYQALKHISQTRAAKGKGGGVAVPDPVADTERNMESAAKKACDRARAEHAERVRYFQQSASDQIARINRRAEEDIAASSPAVSGFPGMYFHTEAPWGRDRIRYDADMKIDSVQRDLYSKISRSEEEMNRKINTLSGQCQSVRSAIGTGSGEVQMIPTGTGMNVRNYVNFGTNTYTQPVELIPLRAKQESFKVK